MAPKASRVSASASGVGDPNFEFVMSVFKNCEQVNLIKPDWNAVAKEHGIKHGHNASSKIKSIVEHHGLTWERNSIKPGAALCNGALNSAKAVVGEPKIASAKGRGRKRKADTDANDDDHGEAGEVDTPGSKKGSVKKGKKRPPVVEAEDEDGGSEAEKVQTTKQENGDGDAESDGVKKAKNENDDSDVLLGSAHF
ncbi:hypothetical protein A1O7_03013 [Cladophialophora yegresii CBS 114405]|uniref:Myb-like DNA-binding domain-containing protein n=1 Tax=Cladophialophora yegresii CBS 114405 TaxID=1182544 RepID=W9WC63_9EURO|nr:uncharacterized protein A1O7_03013 [Cladophialophora yegresii CBS 114405]EXJ62575.1 hypothetical protein A1O7_03013 [Cladophialophora yegresii CBS 114405]